MYFRIKEARKAAKLTQRELAEKLGIKVSTLSGYEIGAHDPKSNTLTEIARICNTTVDYLLGFDNEKQPADIGELSEERTEFINLLGKMTPRNFRLILGIAQLILQEQEAPSDSPG